MRVVVCVCLAVASMAVSAEQIINIESTITGSQEQPKVISIVPWQKPEDPNYFGREISNLGNMHVEFKPMDRAVFVRELEAISAIRKKVKN